MQTPTDFHDLIARVRGGDQAAAAELVGRYEPEIRRLVRLRLTDPKCRVIVDSADISQSVLRVFFVKLGAGAYDLDEPASLLKLLATMIRNKCFDLARKTAVRRSQAVEGGVLEAVADRGESPSDLLVGTELLAEARRRLTDDERALCELRAGGAGWQEIGAAVGDSPDVARKKLRRALERVCRELGLDPVDDE